MVMVISNDERQELLEQESSTFDDSQTKSEEPRKFNLTSKIQKESINIAFKSLMEEVGNLEYKIPKYQRSYVWTKEQIEALIFSLLMDYPIPPIYVYVEPETKERYILDGQQRIISLYLYYCGYTLITNDLIDFNKILPSVEEYKNKLDSLSDDEFETYNGKFLLEYIRLSRYKKKLKESSFKIHVEHPETSIFDLTYKNLSRAIKIELNKKTLNIVTVKTLEDVDNNLNRMEYCEIFNLLNNGGTPLKPQEIRNAIYSSPFYDMLHDVNSNDKWKKIVGKEHKHAKHVELLLRFCSTFTFTTKNSDNNFEFIKNDDGKSVYQGYPTFLNFASDKFKRLSSDEIGGYKIKLIEFIDKFSFDNGTQKFPPLMLEGIFLVSQYKDIKSIDKALQEKIMRNNDYKINIKSSSSSRNKVEERLNIIYAEC